MKNNKRNSITLTKQIIAEKRPSCSNLKSYSKSKSKSIKRLGGKGSSKVRISTSKESKIYNSILRNSVSNSVLSRNLSSKMKEMNMKKSKKREPSHIEKTNIIKKYSMFRSPDETDKRISKHITNNYSYSN